MLQEKEQNSNHVSIKNRKRKDLLSMIILMYAICVLTIKILVAILSGSLSVISESVDAAVDILLIFVMKFGMKKSKENPDSTHTFGKGRFETISTMVQINIIVVIYTLIIYNAVNSIIEGKFGINLEFSKHAIIIFLVFLVSNIIIGLILMRQGKKISSDSIKVQGLAYIFDGVRSAILILAFLLACYFNFLMADPLFAIIISVIVIISTFFGAKTTFDNLLEKNPLSDEEQIKIIENTVAIQDISGIQDMRAKQVGDKIFLTMTILMNNEFRLKECHEKIHEAESIIRKILPDRDLEIIIHVHGY
ncbi:MAG: cation diffusion facilitator family transporter [Promethearchaeota archaeon]